MFISAFPHKLESTLNFELYVRKYGKRVCGARRWTLLKYALMCRFGALPYFFDRLHTSLARRFPTLCFNTWCVILLFRFKETFITKLKCKSLSTCKQVAGFCWMHQSSSETVASFASSFGGKDVEFLNSQLFVNKSHDITERFSKCRIRL